MICEIIGAGVESGFLGCDLGYCVCWFDMMVIIMGFTAFLGFLLILLPILNSKGKGT